MDFNDILKQWEQSPEGKEAAEGGRFSHILQEKEQGERQVAGQTGMQSNTNERVFSGSVRKMRAQEELDLHGMRAEDAVVLVRAFLKDAVSRNLQVVRIVHGRGIHSQNGKSVLKELVRQELRHSPFVRTFSNALPAEGGDGATQVALKRN